MSEPTTRSLLEEHAKRIELAMKESARGSDIEWRDKQSEQWGRISAFIEFQTQYNETDARWKKDHQQQDNDNFDELSAKIDSKVGAVSSHVGSLEGDRERVKAVWKAAGWMVAAVTAVVTAAVWITEKLLEHFDKVRP